MTDVRALIQKQREQLETTVTGDLEVVLGGEKVTLTLVKVRPDEWDDLVAKNPPRPGVEGDAMTGYCEAGVARSYPRVSLNGDELDAETWGEVFDVLDVMHRNNVSVSIWGLNIHSSIKELQGLGKAVPGGK